MGSSLADSKKHPAIHARHPRGGHQPTPRRRCEKATFVPTKNQATEPHATRRQAQPKKLEWTGCARHEPRRGTKQGSGIARASGSRAKTTVNEALLWAQTGATRNSCSTRVRRKPQPTPFLQTWRHATKALPKSPKTNPNERPFAGENPTSLARFWAGKDGRVFA